MIGFKKKIAAGKHKSRYNRHKTLFSCTVEGDQNMNHVIMGFACIYATIDLKRGIGHSLTIRRGGTPQRD